MKTVFVKLLLLVSLSFNIVHDLVIAEHDKNANETVQEYVLEQVKGSDCGNMGESHHMFHLLAVLSSPVPDLKFTFKNEKINFKNYAYIFTLHHTLIKPPIA